MRSTVKYGELQQLIDSVCSCRTAIPGITMKGRNPELTDSRQPRIFGPHTEHERELAETAASALAKPHISHWPAPPDLPVPAGCSRLLLSFLTCCPLLARAPPPGCLLLPGNSMYWKNALVPPQSQHPRQARTHLTSLPMTLTAAQRDCQLYLLPFSTFTLGAPARQVCLRTTWTAC